MSTTSQREQIREKLKAGVVLTNTTTLSMVGTTELRSRIAELKKEGLPVKDRWVRRDGKRFKEYFL